jgi:hypothetical protein
MRFGGGLCRELKGEWQFLREVAVPAREGTGVTAYRDREGDVVEWAGGKWKQLLTVPESVRGGRFDPHRPRAIERCGAAVFFGGDRGLWRVGADGSDDLTLRAYRGPSYVNRLSLTGDGTVLARGRRRFLIPGGRAAAVELEDTAPAYDLDTLPYLDFKNGKRWNLDRGGKLVASKVTVEGQLGGLSRGAGLLGRDQAGREWYSCYDGVLLLEKGRARPIGGWKRQMRCASAGNGIVAAATRSGLSIIDMNTLKEKKLKNVQGDVFSVRVSGEAIWFGLAWSGLFRCSIKDGTVTSWQVPGAKEDKHNNMVRDIAIRGESVFCATNGGVFEFTPKGAGWQRWTAEFANAVLVDGKKNLWMGTRSGLLHYDFALARKAAAARPLDPAVEKLIRQLDHNEWARREKASAALADLGQEALPALLAARKHSSMEVRARVARLLKKLAPDTTVLGDDRARLRAAPVEGRLGK